MARDSNGCEIHLEKAPLKYSGLAPWEILLSEAQERMTLAVPPKNLDPFLQLAEKMEVEGRGYRKFHRQRQIPYSLRGQDGCVS